PMQLSWAAVASYCQHESSTATTTQHVGHHEHQHEADAASANNNSDKSTHPSSAGAVDVDCGTCHAGCCTAMLQSPIPVLAKLPSETHSAPALRLSSQPASLPERPNWADLA
ncbi:MAG: hypothetical protein V4627_02730, partial [Pseudomonadota bacterium]